jgi:type VI secretion system lysozyme-related protein
MPRAGIERTVRQSIVDRLTDDHPQVGADPVIGFQESRDRLLASLRRDIETLLNTRRGPDPVSEEFEELRRSVFYYGLPDLSEVSLDSDDAHARLLRQVKEAVAAFEPRLTQVVVTQAPQPSEDTARREVRFVIHGLLRMDPNPEQVVFDTVLELGSGEYEVRGRHA